MYWDMAAISSPAEGFHQRGYPNNSQNSSGFLSHMTEISVRMLLYTASLVVW